MENTNKTKRKIKYLNVLIFILFFGTIAVVAIYFLTRPKVNYLQGLVEATEIHVAPKVTGRLEKKLVHEGQNVQAGDTLAILTVPELNAKLHQAESAKAAANAQYQKALNGTRSEQIQGALNQWNQAKAASDLAEVTYNRMENLFQEKVIPAQKRDEALANFRASKQQTAAAYENYRMAVNGTRVEDKEASKAQVDQANAAIEEVNINRNEVYIIAPQNGEVEQILPNLGELVNAGYPVVNLIDLNDQWVVFNIREDKMKNIQMNQKFTVTIPALGNKSAELIVKYISPLGDFATWTATKTQGDFDIRTFKIKAYPVNKIEGFRPGMSVLIHSDNLKY